MHNKEITHSENRQFIKNSIDCKDRSFCCLLRETYFRTKKQNISFMKTMQKLDLRLLKIQIL